MELTIHQALVFAVAVAVGSMGLFGCDKAKVSDGSAAESKSSRAIEVSASNQDGLEVAIPVPVSSGTNEKVIEFRPEPADRRLHVLLTNTSQHPISVWRLTNSWGYKALSFEVTDAQGNTHTVAQGGIRIWTANGPMYWIIAPHEHAVLDVDLTDKSWTGITWPNNTPLYYTIRAIYEVNPEEMSEKMSVWTGRITSKTEKYTIYR